MVEIIIISDQQRLRDGVENSRPIIEVMFMCLFVGIINESNMLSKIVDHHLFVVDRAISNEHGFRYGQIALI